MVGNFYHVLNRGVDKRNIFLNQGDYLRFVHDLFEFNDHTSPSNNNYDFRKTIKYQRNFIEQDQNTRKLLVNISSFCLMPSHYHLLLQPLVEDGLFQFIKKLNMGYANYFNKKYQRSGALFQGRYKSVRINDEAHFIHMPYYIHFNPLDLFMPSWREREIDNADQAMNFLKRYRWSSFLDYIGRPNFPSVTQRDTLTEFLGRPKEHEQKMADWLKDLDLKNIKELLLE